MNRMALIVMGIAACSLARAGDGKNRSIEIEAGAVFSGYNTIRIPRDSGTTLSLSEELTAKPTSFFRLRGNYQLGRHAFSLLIAPLTVNSTGHVARDIHYYGAVFPADSFLQARYRFDSYRLSYRFYLFDKPSGAIGLGLTAKIRNASIRLEGAGLMAEKANTGFVPLVNFHLEKRFPGAALLVDGDALAAPQGRAEDVFIGGQLNLGPDVGLYAGYRLLEGGSDVPQVYGFALFHYAAIGLKAKF